MTSAGRVPARDHEVSAAFRLAEELRDQLRRVLQVGVHDADVQPASHVQAGDHGGAQTSLAIGALAQQAADRRVGLSEVEQQIPGGVVAVVDEADLERRRGQGGGDPLHQGLHVVRLVAGGNDEADDWCAAARSFGGHRQRIGVNPRPGHQPSRDRRRVVTGGTPGRSSS